MRNYSCTHLDGREGGRGRVGFGVEAACEGAGGGGGRGFGLASIEAQRTSRYLGSLNDDAGVSLTRSS